MFNTPAGLSLFKVLNESTDVAKDFETPEGASKVVKLIAFKKFRDSTEAFAIGSGYWIY